MQKNRLPAVAQVLEAIPLASSTGKFETLGSNFSNETRICEAACVLILHFLEVFFSYSPSTVKIEANSSVSSGSLSCDLGSKK